MNRTPPRKSKARAAGGTMRGKSQQPKGTQSAEPSISAGAAVSDQHFPVVGIGASAGGLAALKRFFAHVPQDSGLAYVVVVHLSPEHESRLGEILQPHVKMPVNQVTKTTALEKNCVYVIPPNSNLEAIDTHLRLADLEARRQERAPIDHFFRTLAGAHGDQAIGVVLSGTGSDGSLGLRRIKECGGLTVVQDPGEAEYDSMPKSAIGSALVDLVLPVEKMAQTVLRYVGTQARLPVPREGEDVQKDDWSFLQKVFAVVQTRTGRDFSHYKTSTLLRRISRRMQFNHLQEPSAYLELLRGTSHEVQALADDLLINVTSFFRDPEVFELLQRNVVPHLFEGKSPGDTVRVWAVGCATGEEAYSFAILLLEEAARREAPPAVHVFASDLHKPSLDKARGGLYPGDIETDIRPDRLERFFEKENGGYRVRRAVREVVVFAQHNVLSDPPFSRLDLVSCRNLFIYLDRNLHRQVAELFHYALKPDGYLLLGTSESIEESELFRTEDKKHRVYRRRHAAASEPRLPVFSLARRQLAEWPPGPRPQGEPAAFGAFHQRMVEQYAPPSVLLSPDDHVVHFSAHAGRYLVHPGGAPTTSVFQIVRDELRFELRTALSAVRSHRKAVRTRPIPVRFDGQACPVVLDVRPALDPEQEGFVLLIFDERSATPEPPARPERGGARRAPKAGSVTTLRRLEEEKRVAELRLQEIVKEYETGREDLRSSNEELQSANEELRSTLEELETGKEELQSTNEELQTVNQENRHKVEELAQLSSDLQNLFAATDIATLFLDPELRIVRFTPRTVELFSVQPNDRGRPLSDLTHRLGHAGLLDDARQVLDRLVPIQRELRDRSGRWYVMRILPYRADEPTGGVRIAGVVITFVEITERKAMEDALRDAKDYAEQIIKTLPEPLLVLTSGLVVQTANAAFFERFHVKPDQTTGRKVYDLGNGQWNIPALRELLEKILPDNRVFDGYVVDHEFEGLGRRVMLVSGRRLDHMQLILLGISDITDRFRAEEALREADRRKNDFLAMLSHELRNPLAPIRNSLYIMDRAPPGGEQARRAQLVIDRQVAHMTRLIEDLLDVTRITRGKAELHREILDVNDIARRTVEDHRAAFVESGVELEMRAAPEEVWVNGDRTRLSQVFGNLLQNAAKFTPAGGKTTVSVEGDSARREAIVRVQDTGRGIAPEVLRHLFEPFMQADKTLDREKGGLGLGLAVVKGLVEMHGGSVGAESGGRDQGVTFTITLPLDSAGRSAEKQQPRSEAAKQPRRVLVIEDGADAAVTLREVLELSGHVVKVASSGPEGLEVARSFEPDVVICDIGLPEMDGYAVARAMRADPDLRGVTLVALTGYAAPEDVARSKEAGFGAHLAKPPSMEALDQILANAGGG